MIENSSKQQIKVEYDEGLANYFKDLRKYKPLKRDEERKLLHDYKDNNDLIARQKLITSNLRYACSLVNKYSNQGVPVSDLIEEANCGLIESIDNFDINRDVKVITYAKWNIEYKMQEAIRQKNKLKEDDYPDNHETSDLCDDYDVKDDTLDFIPDGMVDDTYTSESNELSNTVSSKLLDEVLVVLNDRESDFIRMYYGMLPYNNEHTYQEIGEKYGITKERVRQIIDKAMRKLRVKVLTIC